MKKDLQIKKPVDIVLRWLIIGVVVLFLVLIVAGLIWEIFEIPMSSHKQSLRKFLMVVGAITVVCLGYRGVWTLLERVGVIKKKPYWLPEWEDYFFRDHRANWGTLLGIGAVVLLVVILVWLAK